MKRITTFPNYEEFEKAKACLAKLALPYEILSPEIAFAKVAIPAIIVEPMVLSGLYASETSTFICSGWVDYDATTVAIPNISPRLFQPDLLGSCAIMVLAPCMADAKKLRLIMHVSGDLTKIFPYLNTEMPQGMYHQEVPIFTFMEAYRMVSLYSKKITIAKADDLIDAWRLLEKIRLLVNQTWLKKDTLRPCFERRQKPPALEIYKRLPGLSCRQCGEKTCMAFALRLWRGEQNPLLCKPIFEGEYGHLKAAFLEIWYRLNN